MGIGSGTPADKTPGRNRTTATETSNPQAQATRATLSRVIPNSASEINTIEVPNRGISTQATIAIAFTAKGISTSGFGGAPTVPADRRFHQERTPVTESQINEAAKAVLSQILTGPKSA
jgi:hypothetical protein